MTLTDKAVDALATVNGGAAVTLTLFGVTLDDAYAALGIVFLLIHAAWWLRNRIKETRTGPPTRGNDE